MTRDDHEMALWREAYSASRLITRAGVEAEADAAVEAFRQRYPPKPAAPEAVWYDEPPFAKDGEVHYCWVADCSVPQSVYWSNSPRGWCYFAGNTPIYPLNGRRVCPIVKPQEPKQ